MKPNTRELPEIQTLWDYDDPAGTAARLQAVLPAAETAGDRSYHAELLTQIARTHSLQRAFEEAHATLDAADAMITADMPRARVRSLLERGRTLNSAGRADEARPLFLEAWELAQASRLDGLAVDAAHMMAIVKPGEAFAWNERALVVARSSPDPDARRWCGSLHNNIGWTRHGAGDYDAALARFEAGLAARLEQGTPADVRVARWCVARCLRSLERTDEALAILRELEAELAATGQKPDGYVYEEIAECLLALGDEDAARPWFARAHEVLSQDAWLNESEPERIARLSRLGERTP